MPIYVVRWPGLVASLVRAEDEEQLLDILDQVGNADDCEWSVYEGPLFLHFELPAKSSCKDERPGEPVAPEQVVVEDVGPMAERHVVDTMEMSLAECDEGHDTGMAILEKAFPNLHAAIERLVATDDGAEREGVLSEPELRKALHAELARLLKASWRQAQLERKTDAVSTLAREMDLSVALARQYAELAQEAPQGDDDDPTTEPEGS